MSTIHVAHPRVAQRVVVVSLRIDRVKFTRFLSRRVTAGVSPPPSTVLIVLGGAPPHNKHVCDHHPQAPSWQVTSNHAKMHKKEFLSAIRHALPSDDAVISPIIYFEFSPSYSSTHLLRGPWNHVSYALAQPSVPLHGHNTPLCCL